MNFVCMLEIDHCIRITACSYFSSKN